MRLRAYLVSLSVLVVGGYVVTSDLFPFSYERQKLVRDTSHWLVQVEENQISEEVLREIVANTPSIGSGAYIFLTPCSECAKKSATKIINDLSDKGLQLTFVSPDINTISSFNISNYDAHTVIDRSLWNSVVPKGRRIPVIFLSSKSEVVRVLL